MSDSTGGHVDIRPLRVAELGGHIGVEPAQHLGFAI